MPPQKTKQLHLQLKAIPNWSKRAHTLCRTFTCKGFFQSINFVNRVATGELRKAIISRISTFVLIR
jgi:pterin-4a-carbinolamine dehydratase